MNKEELLESFSVNELEQKVEFSMFCISDTDPLNCGEGDSPGTCTPPANP